MVRRLRENDLFALLSVLVGAFVLLGVPFLFSIARDVGEAFAAGNTAAATSIVAAVCGLWLFTVVLTAAEAMGSGGRVDHEECELAIRPPKDVACGLMLQELLAVGGLILLPSLVGLAGLSLGLGTAVPIVGGLVGVTAVILTAPVVGFAVGFLVRGFVRRSRLLSRLKPLVGTAFGAGLLLVIFSGRFVPWMIDAGTYLVDSPLGWFGDLTLLTTAAVDPSLGRAVGAVGLTLFVLFPGSLALVRAAEFAWDSDPVHPSEDEEPGSSKVTRSRYLSQLDTALGQLGVHSVTRAVTTTAFVRAYRAPLQLLYVAVPVVFVLPLLDEIVRAGEVPEYTVWVVVLYCAWASGAAFSLNLLGNQKPILPVVLLSRATGRHVVHGYVLAGCLLVVPPGTALAVVAGHLSGFSTAELVVVAVVSPLVVAAGAVLAAGCGARFPRFTAIQLTGSNEALPPSIWAFAVFSLGVLLPVGSVAVLSDETVRRIVPFLVDEYLPYGIEVTEASLEVAAVVVVLAMLCALPLSYVFAVRRFDDYRLA